MPLCIEFQKMLKNTIKKKQILYLLVPGGTDPILGSYGMYRLCLAVLQTLDEITDIFFFLQ